MPIVPGLAVAWLGMRYAQEGVRLRFGLETQGALTIETRHSFLRISRMCSP